MLSFSHLGQIISNLTWCCTVSHTTRMIHHGKPKASMLYCLQRTGGTAPGEIADLSRKSCKPGLCQEATGQLPTQTVGLCGSSSLVTEAAEAGAIVSFQTATRESSSLSRVEVCQVFTKS